MRNERFAAWFEKESRWTFWSIVAVLTVMWLATLLDFAFGLEWGWDRRGLFLAPLILLIAAIIRYWHVAFAKLIERLSKDS
ncbi:hypothetical protein [Sandarakinorhabdus oryzae]|uniref:hypothetical protein n=1 Tax=Sandarakinorhabdus oryzae TaxID=2675220 RepID=UPI0012E15C22|nr:hypothetical protein [Sandarakinorhabdus oryzae]